MYIRKDLNYSWMTYPQINQAAHCLQPLATLWRAPQTELSIHTAHFCSASFFCLPPSEVHQFLWEQNTSSEWTELGAVPTKSRVERSALQIAPRAREGAGRWRARVSVGSWPCASPSAHEAHTCTATGSPHSRRLGTTPSIPFCFNIAENCFDSWIASLFITRS